MISSEITTHNMPSTAGGNSQYTDHCTSNRDITAAPLAASCIVSWP